MRWEDQRRSRNVDDRRRSSGGSKVAGGGGLIIVIALAFYFFSGDDSLIRQVASQPMGSTQSTNIDGTSDARAEFSSTILASTEDIWGQLYPQISGGERYIMPQIVLYTQGTASGCGTAQSAMGPFYCPVDQKVYLDVRFFDELSQKFGAPGDFAPAYVIAHEVGHHIQNQLGIIPEVQRAQRNSSQKQANALQVNVELMADCLAGVWAYYADNNYNLLERGDIEEGMRAAWAVGDDTLQKRSQGYVVPDAFTHGSAEQRMYWFNQGYQSGNPSSCNSFN